MTTVYFSRQNDKAKISARPNVSPELDGGIGMILREVSEPRYTVGDTHKWNEYPDGVDVVELVFYTPESVNAIIDNLIEYRDWLRCHSLTADEL